MKQTYKVVPLITCEMSFGQNVCKLILGVNTSDPNLWNEIDSVKQPVKRTSVGSGNMSSSGTSTSDGHVDHSFIVFKNIQLRCIMGTLRARGNKLNMR